MENGINKNSKWYHAAEAVLYFQVQLSLLIISMISLAFTDKRKNEKKNREAEDFETKIWKAKLETSHLQIVI